MPAVRLLSATTKPATGTPGSSAVEHGFDVRVETRPNLAAYRVAVVWTPDGWRTVTYTECRLAEVRDGAETWAGSISFFTTPNITFFFAVAAAGSDGTTWDNNFGQNHAI
jgi:hypothetical protein